MAEPMGLATPREKLLLALLATCEASYDPKKLQALAHERARLISLVFVIKEPMTPREQQLVQRLLRRSEALVHSVESWRKDIAQQLGDVRQRVNQLRHSAKTAALPTRLSKRL